MGRDNGRSSRDKGEVRRAAALVPRKECGGVIEPGDGSSITIGGRDPPFAALRLGRTAGSQLQDAELLSHRLPVDEEESRAPRPDLAWVIPSNVQGRKR